VRDEEETGNVWNNAYSLRGDEIVLRKLVRSAKENKDATLGKARCQKKGRSNKRGKGEFAGKEGTTKEVIKRRGKRSGK